MKDKQFPYVTVAPNGNAITWHLQKGEYAFSEDSEELDNVPEDMIVVADYTIDGELIAVEIIFSTDKDTE